MSFPIKMSVPTYMLTIPSTKEKVAFRPFLVGEQKSMMLATATEDLDTIVNAIKTLVKTCSSDKVAPDRLTSFDLEYLFLQLRSKSIGEGVDLAVACHKCEAQIRFVVDVSKAEVSFEGTQEPKIQLSADIGVMMSYPSLQDTITINAAEKINATKLFDIVANCILQVWDKDELVDAKDHTQDDIKEFLNTLTGQQLDKLVDFVMLVPGVHIDQDVTCKCGHTSKVSIVGLENFFV